MNFHDMKGKRMSELVSIQKEDEPIVLKFRQRTIGEQIEHFLNLDISNAQKWIHIMAAVEGEKAKAVDETVRRFLE